jgi:hypothetical protein
MLGTTWLAMIQRGLCSLEDGGLKMDRPEKFPARTEFIKTGMVEALIGVEPLDNSSSLKDMIWTMECLSPNLIEAVLFFQLVRQLALLESTVLTYTYGPVDRLAAAVRIVLRYTSSNKDCRNPRQNLVRFFFSNRYL